MDNRRKSLPPLDTLVFFETTLRAGSFSAAASELYVSQAAVSKRIRQLEDWLGVTLFERGARGLELTPAGAQLADPVTMSLDYLNAALAQVSAPASPSIRIAANSAVAVFWLFNRLRAFALSPAACPVESVTTDDPRDLLGPENDIAIIYADRLPDGWDGAMLMPEELAPVASPEAAAHFAQAPQSLPLLEYRRHAPDWVNWEVWLQRDPVGVFLRMRKDMCQSYSHSIGLALEGKGVALASCSLLRDELQSGRLSVLITQPIKTGKSYFLVWRPNSPRQEAITGLIRHLRTGS